MTRWKRIPDPAKANLLDPHKRGVEADDGAWLNPDGLYMARREKVHNRGRWRWRWALYRLLIGEPRFKLIAHYPRLRDAKLVTVAALRN